jgi:hypothetical protein
MVRIARLGLTVGALAFAFSLAACDTFDPTELFDSDLLSTKKKLPGERQPIFPEGTPGVPQGVPPELMKGYQPAQPDPVTTQAVAPPAEEKPKPKAKPKPKVVAKPPEQSGPTAITVRPPVQQASPSQQSAPPPQQPVTAGAWPSSQPSPGAGVAWPDPPPTR